MLADDIAISLLSKRLSETRTPLVFLGLNANPREYQLHGYKNFTGVLEHPLFKRSLLFVDLLLPDKKEKKLLILSDTSPTSIAALDPINHNKQTIMIGNIQLDSAFVTNEIH